MSYSIAIVGSKEEVSGFSALGVKGFYANTSDEAREVLFQLKKGMTDESVDKEEKYAIIFIIEELFSGISDDDYKKLSSGALPAIISLPGNQGSTGFGNEKIRRIVEKAVGSDIFGND